MFDHSTRYQYQSEIQHAGKVHRPYFINAWDGSTPPHELPYQAHIGWAYCEQQAHREQALAFNSPEPYATAHAIRADIWYELAEMAKHASKHSIAKSGIGQSAVYTIWQRWFSDQNRPLTDLDFVPWSIPDLYQQKASVTSAYALRVAHHYQARAWREEHSDTLTDNAVTWYRIAESAERDFNGIFPMKCARALREQDGNPFRRLTRADGLPDHKHLLRRGAVELKLPPVVERALPTYPNILTPYGSATITVSDNGAIHIRVDAPIAIHSVTYEIVGWYRPRTDGSHYLWCIMDSYRLHPDGKRERGNVTNKAHEQMIKTLEPVMHRWHKQHPDATDAVKTITAHNQILHVRQKICQALAELRAYNKYLDILEAELAETDDISETDASSLKQFAQHLAVTTR